MKELQSHEKQQKSWKGEKEREREREGESITWFSKELIGNLILRRNESPSSPPLSSTNNITIILSAHLLFPFVSPFNGSRPKQQKTPNIIVRTFALLITTISLRIVATKNDCPVKDLS